MRGLPERAIRALKQGAVDYVLKEGRARLVPAIERALREAEERDAKALGTARARKDEERFRLAMQFSSVGMALVAPDGRWLSVNPALCTILGYSESELLATEVSSLTHPDDREADAVKARQMLEHVIETYQTNKRWVCKDGGVLWTQLSSSLVWLQSGEANYFIDQIQDITDRINAERALRASEERFRSIVEATQEWIWELDAEGLYTFCSPAVNAILGIAPDELLGKSCLDLLPAAIRPTLDEQRRRGIAEKAGWRELVLEYWHAAGAVRWLESNALPLLDAGGNVAGFRGVTRDITHQRLQQERIARLSRIQAVLSGINSTIVRVRERGELLCESCRIAVRNGGFKMAWIGLVEPGAMKAAPLAWEGLDDGYLDEMGLTLANRTEDPGPVGEALRTKKMVVVNDIETSNLPLLKQQALARGFRSQLAMPLMVEERTVGIMVLYAADAGFFDHDELRLLQDLAGDISFALDYINKEEKLNYVAYYDTLTGLANRQLFFDRLGQALHAARAEVRQVAVMMIDDRQRFKTINDTLGRHAGDLVLKELANRQQRTISEFATAARIGGDRFGVIVPDLPGSSMTRWIIDSFAEVLVVNDVELRTAVKIGIALYPADAETAEELHSLGCGEAQGYLFTRPMPAADISPLLPPLQ